MERERKRETNPQPNEEIVGNKGEIKKGNGKKMGGARVPFKLNIIAISVHNMRNRL